MSVYKRGDHEFVVKPITIGGALFYHLSIRPPLTDEEYDDVKYRLERLGGHWRERFGGFVFDEDPSEALKDERTWKPVNHSEHDKWRIARQFYPTPPDLAKQVVELCEIEEHHTVLEPSAGTGALLAPITRTNGITAVEIDEDMANKLREKGYEVINHDFRSLVVETEFCTREFDRIVMNPPFSPNSLGIAHIRLAYSLLANNGVMVAVLNENSLYYNTEATRCFNKFLHDVDAKVIEVPSRSFLASGTRVDTVLIKIRKNIDEKN